MLLKESIPFYTKLFGFLIICILTLYTLEISDHKFFVKTFAQTNFPNEADFNEGPSLIGFVGVFPENFDKAKLGKDNQLESSSVEVVGRSPAGTTTTANTNIGTDNTVGFVGRSPAGTTTANTNIGTDNQLESSTVGVIGPALTSDKNLPMDLCKVKDSTQFRPISATYNFEGKTSISKIKEIATTSSSIVDGKYPRKYAVQQLIFEILFDNVNANLKPSNTNPDKTIKLTPTNSIFKGKIYGDQEPYNHEVAGFTIDRVWTNCEFIPIVNAQTSYKGSSESSAEGTKIVPLGQLDHAIPSNAQVPSDLDRDSSVKLGTKENGLLPSTASKTELSNLGSSNQNNILNPPFVSCKNIFEIDSNAQNVISNYKVVSGIDSSKLVGIEGEQKISLRITVDLIPSDQAFLTENNNAMIKLNLVINPGEFNVKVIPLSLISISTDCMNVSYSDSEVQQF